MFYFSLVLVCRNPCLNVWWFLGYVPYVFKFNTVCTLHSVNFPPTCFMMALYRMALLLVSCVDVDCTFNCHCIHVMQARDKLFLHCVFDCDYSRENATWYGLSLASARKTNVLLRDHWPGRDWLIRNIFSQ